MKTTEGNKLIMEFLGMRKDKISSPYYYDQPNGRYYDENETKYHTSWDWLMPVVEKIESFGYNPKIHYDLFMVEDKDSLRHVTETSASPKIMAVWYGVIEFIQWYNENKEDM